MLVLMESKNLGWREVAVGFCISVGDVDIKDNVGSFAPDALDE